MVAEVALDSLVARARRIRFYRGDVETTAPVLDLHGAECDGLAALCAVDHEEPLDGDFVGQATMVLRGWLFPMGQADLRMPDRVHLQGRPTWSRLSRPSEVFSWLADKGWTEPLVQLRRTREAKSDTVLRDEWLNRAPLCVRHLATEATRWTSGSLPADLAGRVGLQLQQNLRLPERTIALLRWAGSAGGRFREEADLPSYEGLPLMLLQAYQTSEIVQYAASHPDEALRVGALRLWTGWRFRARVHELRMVPAALAEQLVSLAVAIGPESRAMRAKRRLLGI